MKTMSLDERRQLLLPGNEEACIACAVEEWLKAGQEAIADHGFFAVALSGGSTPKKIYTHLSTQQNRSRLDWTKVYLFWSDERMVPPTDPESNYHMAFVEGGFQTLPFKKENIFRMEGEKEIEKGAKEYEARIKATLQGRPFDLMMLGMGDDGHTASLFPHTEALHMVNRKVAPNFVPQKNTWRMTLTFECINLSKRIVFYVWGANKGEIIAKVLTSPYDPDTFPSQRVGTAESPAQFLLDEEASKNLLALLK